MAETMGMPKIGVNMAEAQIVKWVIAEGDRVSEGQHILDAETDKTVQEIYSTMAGTIAKIIAKEGDTVRIFEPIAIVAKEGEAPPAPPEKILQPKTRPRISPLAKKTAKQLGIDCALVKPAQSGARICKADVLRYAGEAPPAAAVTPPSANREAGRSESYLTVYADMAEFVKLREKFKTDGGGIGISALLGLCVSRALEDIAGMAGKVDIKISGAERFAPALGPDEYFALGAGAIIKKPVVITENGEDVIAVRPMMGLTLRFDQTVIESAAAERFLQKLKHAAENPLLLLI